MAAAPVPMKSLTLEEARAALKEVIAAFDVPENKMKIDAAKAQAGDNFMLILQIVLPVAMQIQQMTIEKYGFDATQQGVTAFAVAVRQHNSDAEVATLATELKNRFLPPGVPGF
eukprot:GILK01004137.1.p1 GENE.GILK01004137.1~~GILK01004137.1.p1  ORF type:complete len:128 (+),score=29.82 GILK01004137.1:44-385(+)